MILKIFDEVNDSNWKECNYVITCDIKTHAYVDTNNEELYCGITISESWHACMSPLLSSMRKSRRKIKRDLVYFFFISRFQSLLNKILILGTILG